VHCSWEIIIFTRVARSRIRSILVHARYEYPCNVCMYNIYIDFREGYNNSACVCIHVRVIMSELIIDKSKA
jgi:pyrrolidone-carboxylate peptidase